MENDKKEDSICPVTNEKCIQIDSIVNIRNKVNSLEMNQNNTGTILQVMVDSVDRTNRVVESLAVEVKEILHMSYENKLGINENKTASEMANVKQDNKQSEKELSGYREDKKDKRKLTNKAKNTFIGIIVTWATLKVTGVFDIVSDFLFESIK